MSDSVVQEHGVGVRRSEEGVSQGRPSLWPTAGGQIAMQGKQEAITD